MGSFTWFITISGVVLVAYMYIYIIAKLAITGDLAWLSWHQ